MSKQDTASAAVPNVATNKLKKTDAWVAVTKVILGIMIFPAFCYFFCKLILMEAILGYTHPESNFWAATISIGLAHVVLAGVIYLAFWERPEPRKRD